MMCYDYYPEGQASTIQKVKPHADPTNAGKGLRCLLWIAEFSDYTRLAPIGTVGELLTQGPNVARGHVNPDVDTSMAFSRSFTAAQS